MIVLRFCFVYLVRIDLDSSSAGPKTLALCRRCSSTRNMLSEGRREGLRLSLSRSLSEPNHPNILFHQQLLHEQHEQRQTARASCHDPEEGVRGNGDVGSISLGPELTSSAASSTSGLRLPMFPVSMPSSPCSDSVALQRSLLLRRVRNLEPSEVARRITRAHRPKPFVLLDLRPFFHYNLRHVRSAINLNCSDRFNRKRLQLKRATVVDLAAPAMREHLKRRGYRDVIVYDESTSDVASLPADHPVFLVLSAINEDNREPMLLKG